MYIWSVFEHIQSKRCNRLVQKRPNDLVYVHDNLMLCHRHIYGADRDVIILDEIDPFEWITEHKNKNMELGEYYLTEEDFKSIERKTTCEFGAMEQPPRMT